MNATAIKLIVKQLILKMKAQVTGEFVLKDFKYEGKGQTVSLNIAVTWTDINFDYSMTGLEGLGNGNGAVTITITNFSYVDSKENVQFGELNFQSATELCDFAYNFEALTDLMDMVFAN